MAEQSDNARPFFGIPTWQKDETIACLEMKRHVLELGLCWRLRSLCIAVVHEYVENASDGMEVVCHWLKKRANHDERRVHCECEDEDEIANGAFGCMCAVLFVVVSVCVWEYGFVLWLLLVVVVVAVYQRVFVSVCEFVFVFVCMKWQRGVK